MTVDHERYQDDVSAYLLGALPELEAQLFERHLLGCADCRDELERLQPAAHALLHAVEPTEPPTSLKRSLMETVEAEPRESVPAAPRREHRRPRAWALWGRIQAVAAAAVAVGALVIGFGVGRWSEEGSSTRVLKARVDASALPLASARLEVSGGRRPALLRVSGMPALGAGRVYEVWVLKGRTMRPAGSLFDVRADGTGTAAIPQGVRGVDQVLVTREPAGGSPLPSESPVIRVTV